MSNLEHQIVHHGAHVAQKALEKYGPQIGAAAATAAVPVVGAIPVVGPTAAAGLTAIAAGTATASTVLVTAACIAAPIAVVGGAIWALVTIFGDD
jgi:hypothetical protein